MTREQPGRVVGGRYRLLHELGSGGFGRVWRAHDEILNVDVAVKEVWLPQQPGFEQDHHRRVVRAAREARNAAKLRDHQHIVAVHDVVVEDGRPWIVMRLVDGCSLGERLRAEGPLTAPRVADVAVALLKALKAAHAAGLVHRDLKPANVLLTADGHVLLTDFGIAVHEHDTRGLTETGTVIGSVEYMAPERLQAAKDHGSADLFSLGATLYEAVEGVSPFQRDTLGATAAALAAYEPPAPRRADPVLARLITALLAKDPNDRPTADHALAMFRQAREQATSKPPLSDQAWLAVHNKRGGHKVLRVSVDDNDVGTVKENQTRTFTAAKGLRTVQVRKGPHRSASCVVHMTSGSTVRLVALRRGTHLLLGTSPESMSAPRKEWKNGRLIVVCIAMAALAAYAYARIFSV